MKAKLSFLAFALSLGLVITFVIAACSSDSNNSPVAGGTSSNSYGGGVNSSAISNKGIDITFTVSPSGEKVYINATIEGTFDEPIVKVEFVGIPPSWISSEEPYELPSKLVNLYATIDLNEKSIECGKEYSVQLKACIDAACSADKMATSQIETFTKPDYICGISSDNGGGASSASVAPWVFAAPETVEVPVNTYITIGSGSIKLTGDDELEAQPDIAVSNGTIRRPTAIGDDDVVVGKEYSSSDKFLGSTVPTATTDVVQNQEYYLIYLNDGSKYLLFFEKGAISFAAWPKKCTYWKATKFPE